MLIDIPMISLHDNILESLFISGKSHQIIMLQPGIYLVNHFGSSNWPKGFKQYPEDLEINCYGVCDNFQQILDQCPTIVNSELQFIIVLHEINKFEEPPDDGWRWHKWGPYIGTQNPTHEYIYDEPIIEQVFVYHVYEKK